MTDKIKVGDVLEGYEVVSVEGNQVALKGTCAKGLYLGYVRGDTLFVEDDGPHCIIPLTPKPVYDGAFGESVEAKNMYYKPIFDGTYGKCKVTGIFAVSDRLNVFTSKEACQSYCDALNCLEIDLRENSVVPVDGVEQWSLYINTDGKMFESWVVVLTDKLTHALPWYKTREEAEKHLPNADVIIKSLEVKKGINQNG